MTALTLDIEYLPEYADKNSDEYKKLVAQIRETILAALESKGVVGVQVLSLTNGSVIVKMRLALSNGSIDTADLMKAINDAISDGDLASIGATGSVAIKG